jgi:hypothetical protein
MSDADDPRVCSHQYRTAVSALLALDPAQRVCAYAESSEAAQQAVDAKYLDATFGAVQSVLHSWTGWLCGRALSTRYDSLAGWLHGGECRQTPNGWKYFVAYPRSITLDDIRAILACCTDYDLHCSVGTTREQSARGAVRVILQTKEQHRRGQFDLASGPLPSPEVA